MNQRFGAYLADYIVIYLISLSVFFIWGLVGKSVPEGDAVAKAVFVLALCAYMTIAQAAYHTTVGKYVVGLEVSSASSDGVYPTFGRILLRETLGRFLSFLFWGAGYWVAVKHPRKQAWSDRMADTVVCIRKTDRSLRRALTAFVLVSLVFDVGLTAWGYQVQERSKAYKALSQETESLYTKIGATRGALNKIVARQPSGMDGFQANMRELLPYLDQYDQQVDRLQSLYQRSLTEDLLPSDAERNQIRVLQRVFRLRKQQIQKQREEANLVLQFDPAVDDSSGLVSHLKLLDSDIAGLEHQASQTLTEIGAK